MRKENGGGLCRIVCHVIPCDICHGVRNDFVCRVEL